MKQQNTKSVTITQHAMLRLKERVGTFAGFHSWEHLVRTARYRGKSATNMSDSEYEWVVSHVGHLTNSSKVRLMNGFAFLFMGNKGHARTLVTVIAMAA